MARFKLEIEYEGTRYSGWQVQKNSKTIQGSLLNAADSIFKGEKVDIQGSGRTDSGVHALCQIAHLEVNTTLTPEIIRMRFNDNLPYDINLLSVQKIHSKFHARHDAISRSYVYQISRRRTAFGKSFVWWVKDNLNFSKMNSASKIFLGMKNFSSFTDDVELDKSTKVLIEEIQLVESGNLILIKIKGSHFLWKMVRRIVGILVEIGRGNIPEERLKYYLSETTNEPAKFTAPPSGLFLEQVLYKGDKPNNNITPFLSIM